MRDQKKKTEHALPPDVVKNFPKISTALTLRTYQLLDLLHWIEEHPAHIEPTFKRTRIPKDEVMSELCVLADTYGDNAGSNILRDLYKMLHYASMYLVQNTCDSEDDVLVMWSMGNVIHFFEELYKRNII